MKKSQNEKKKLIIDRQQPRVRLPSVKEVLREKDCFGNNKAVRQKSMSTSKVLEESKMLNYRTSATLMKRSVKIGKSLSKLKESS